MAFNYTFAFYFAKIIDYTEAFDFAKLNCKQQVRLSPIDRLPSMTLLWFLGHC